MIPIFLALLGGAWGAAPELSEDLEVTAAELASGRLRLALPDAPNATLFTSDGTVPCGRVATTGYLELAREELPEDCRALFAITGKSTWRVQLPSGGARTLKVELAPALTQEAAWCDMRSKGQPAWCDTTPKEAQGQVNLNRTPAGDPAGSDFSGVLDENTYVFDTGLQRWRRLDEHPGVWLDLRGNERLVRFDGAWSHAAAAAKGTTGLLLRWETSGAAPLAWTAKVGTAAPASIPATAGSLESWCPREQAVARVEETGTALYCLDVRDPLVPQARLVTPPRRDWVPNAASEPDTRVHVDEEPYLRGDQPLDVLVLRSPGHRVAVTFSGSAGAPLGHVDAGGERKSPAAEGGIREVELPLSQAGAQRVLLAPRVGLIEVEVTGSVQKDEAWSDLPKRKLELVGMPRYVAAFRTGVGAAVAFEEHVWELVTQETGERTITRTRTTRPDPEIVLGFTVFPRGRTYWPGGRHLVRPAPYFGVSALGPAVPSSDLNIGFFRTQYFGVDLELRRQLSISAGVIRRQGEALKDGLREGQTWHGSRDDITRPASFGGIFLNVNFSPIYFRTLAAGGLEKIPTTDPTIDGGG